MGFSDRDKYVADADWVDVPLAGLLNATYTAQRADALLDPHPTTAIPTPVPAGSPPLSSSLSASEAKAVRELWPSADLERKGTTHFCVVDEDRNVRAGGRACVWANGWACG